MEHKARVVVLGAGFGGLEFCKSFQHEDAEIILVDRQNHHLFQPLLYQVATAGLSQPEIAQPIRSIFTKRKDITVLMDEAVSVDLASRKVHCNQQTWNTTISSLAWVRSPVTSDIRNGRNMPRPEIALRCHPHPAQRAARL
jgi:NADH dehydrogenase FAD-containing subunit